MMKFSIVRTDKNNGIHVSVKTVEWFMERIRTDTKAGDIGRLRQHVLYYGNVDYYDKYASVAKVYPAVELKKTENGMLEVTAFNSLTVLHVSGLLRPEDRAAVKESAKLLPMTMAAFDGSDGRSVEIIVAVNDNDNQNDNQNQNDNVDVINEDSLNQFCSVAYETAVGVYNGLLPQPVEREAVSARSWFPMTLDPAPYYNPSPTPLKVLTKAITSTSIVTPTSSFPSPDYSLYALYEQMYECAVGEAGGDVAEVPEDQWLEAYITALARRLCEKGVPEEEAFLHLRNHYVYKQTYDEDTFRAIVSAVYAEAKPKRRGGNDMVSRDARRLINFLTTRYVFRYNTVMGYTEYRPNNTWVQDWLPCDENVVNGMTI